MKNDPKKGIFPGVEADRAAWGDCGCWSCVSAHVTERDGHSLFMPFIVCSDCGNKRCPKATHHDNACTGSNDPQQPGSRYGGLT